METILNILTIQADLKWEDKEKNRRHLFDLANPSAKKATSLFYRKCLIQGLQ